MFGFSLKTRGLDQLSDTFKQFPKHVRGVVAEAASDYIIGTPQRGLKKYPPYRHVPRASAFRPPYASERQRKFVMAGIKSGALTPGYPKRTGQFQRSWVRVGSGVNSRISGELPHENWPNPLAKKIGWRDPGDIIDSNIAGAAREAERAVQRSISEKGLG